MSMSPRLRSSLAALACSATLLACVPRGPSTVAQGKYYSSANPRYDEFFIGLYNRQIAMEIAVSVPPAEEQRLASVLALPPGTPLPELEAKLREKAIELAHGGVRARLDRESKGVDPNDTRAILRASSRPKSDLLDGVEASATNLLRLGVALKNNELELNRLERQTVSLDADVDSAFPHTGQRNEVKRNLADAHKLIALMRVRSAELGDTSAALVAAITQAVNTDDGSLPPVPSLVPPPVSVPSEASKPPPSETKKKPAKPRPAAAVSKPKPAPASDDAPAAPKPAKPAPAPRDFEP